MKVISTGIYCMPSILYKESKANTSQKDMMKWSFKYLDTFMLIVHDKYN